jgi:ATP-dependent RNA helicase RhlE
VYFRPPKNTEHKIETMNKLLDIQLVENLNQNGITEFNELQQVCIPKLKSGGDLLCIAEKGCGKSLTIVLSVLQKLKGPSGDNPRALIVVPDVDRAMAMKEEFSRLGAYTKLRVNTACENEKVNDQKDRIYMGSDVVIGTPKRIIQIYTLYSLNLTGVKIFALDDAEEVLRNFNYTQILRLAEAPTKTQQVVFANRTNEWIERFADELMNIQEIFEFDNKPENEDEQEVDEEIKQ